MFTYVWCCDFRDFTGEGNLARNFLLHLAKEKKKNFIIFSPQGIWKLNKSIRQNKSFFNRSDINPYFMDYFYPFIGIIILWFFFFLGKKTIYLNFCPLWNFFIFMLSPPKNIFGPITGSIYKGKVISLSTFVRKYIFIIFFNISLFFISLRKIKIILSTSLLVRLFLKKKIIFFVNYQILNFFHDKKIININFKKKDIDLIIYNRKHDFKNDNYFLNIISKFNLSFKIYVLGNKIENKGITNIGTVSNNLLRKYLRRTKYIISSAENLYSFLNMEAMFYGAKVIYTEMPYNQNLTFFKENFYFIKKDKRFLEFFYKILSKKVIKNNNSDLNTIKILNKKFCFFIKNYFI